MADKCTEDVEDKRITGCPLQREFVTSARAHMESSPSPAAAMPAAAGVVALSAAGPPPPGAAPPPVGLRLSYRTDVIDFRGIV